MNRTIRNIVTVEDSIRIEKVQFKSQTYNHYVFKCKHDECTKEIKVRRNHIKYITGKCKKHANMHKPFEANFGGMRRNAKERNIEFTLTYADYLKFTEQYYCSYCGNKINWQPYNEHGKNNPGYYLDRVVNDKGYTCENCVVCCTRCNFMKSNLDKEDFLDHIKKIAYKITGA